MDENEVVGCCCVRSVVVGSKFTWTLYKEAKRSPMLPKKVMGRGSRMLSLEANCMCSSCRSMIEGCLKSTLLMVEAADVDEVLEA